MKSCPLCNTTYASGDTCPDDGATLITLSPRIELFVGQVLKEAYRIEERVSAGGMGVVYRATQLRLGRNVALKVVQPHHQSTPDIIKRFFREARLLSQVSHPNIVSIIDFGNTEDGLIYMVMEYLEGKTLHKHVQNNRGLALHEIVHIMQQVCQGVAAAHQYPIIHRDLKPSNIFLARIAGDGHVAKILDFGISKTLDDSSEPTSDLTKTGVILGTPGYISPEQISGATQPGIRADIYALGGILYFMLSGRRPFHEETHTTALLKQLSERPSPIDPSRLTEPRCVHLIPVAARAMQPDPEARYPDVPTLMEAIHEAAEQEQPAAALRTGKAGLSQGPLPLRAAPDPGNTQDLTQTLPLAAHPDPAPAPGRKRRLHWAGGGVLVALTALTLWMIVGPGRSATPHAGVTRNTITVGMSAAFSGPAREIGRDMQVGMETYFKTVNDAGGVRGRSIALIALDDGYEPEQALTNMKTLIEERQVFAVIGNVGTPTAQVTAPYAVAQRVLFFGAFTGADLLRQDPPERYVFNYRASYAQETAAMVQYFIEVKGFTPAEIAVFAQNDSYGDAGFRGVAITLRAYDHHADDILRVGYERNTVVVDEAVATLLAHPVAPRAIVMVGTYKPSARFIQHVKEAGLDVLFANVSFVGSQALAEEFREIGAHFADGVIVTQVVPHYAAQTTGVLDYQEHLSRYEPSEQPGFISLEGYVTAQLLVEGLRRAEELTTESVIDALESIRDLDLGMGSVINLGPSQHQASDKVWGTVLDETATYHILNLE